MDDDPLDAAIDAAVEDGFLPPDPEALEAAIRTMRVTALIAIDEDTVDGLLVGLGTSFHHLVTVLLPRAGDPPMAGRPGVVIDASMHVCAIAALLTFLNLESRHNAEHAQDTRSESTQELFGRWLEVIIDVSRSQHPPPWHLSPTDYVSSTAGRLGMIVPIVREKPWLSLDPSDPRLRDRHLRDLSRDETPEDAAWELVWCAASALCISACTAPDFRLGDASETSPVTSRP